MSLPLSHVNAMNSKFSYVTGYISGKDVYQSTSDFYFDDVMTAAGFVGGQPTKELFLAALTEASREAAYEAIATAADNFHREILFYTHIIYNGLCVDFHKEYTLADHIDFEDMCTTVEDELVNRMAVKFGTVIAQLPEEDVNGLQ